MTLSQEDVAWKRSDVKPAARVESVDEGRGR
jgi:hypothetical protein